MGPRYVRLLRVWGGGGACLLAHPYLSNHPPATSFQQLAIAFFLGRLVIVAMAFRAVLIGQLADTWGRIPCTFSLHMVLMVTLGALDVLWFYLILRMLGRSLRVEQVK